MDLAPDKTLLQYITKKTRKLYPTWQDINELGHAKEKMIYDLYSNGDTEDYYKIALDRVKFDIEKIGVMVSFGHPEFPNLMAIAYSLCNTSVDKFDYQPINVPITGFMEAKGLGLHIALGRATEWVNTSKIISVPPSIKPQFIKFIDRSQRYYKDKDVPAWVTRFLTEHWNGENSKRPQLQFQTYEG